MRNFGAKPPALNPGTYVNPLTPRSGGHRRWFRFPGVGACTRTALQVPVGDGRVLEVVLFGPEDGAPVFVHHGTPGTAGMFEVLVDAGAQRHLRHVTYARPGYGGSTRLPGRTVASCVGDVEAIADALGYERFHSVGTSGGGPHSIACAARLPERVISAAAIATPAPLDAEGLDWTAGMGRENIAEIAATRGSDDELREYLEREAGKMRLASADDIVAVLGDIVSDADRGAVTGGYADWVASQFAGSVAVGVWGWFDDDRALFRDWGFDLREIGAPLTIWHGAEDRFVPIAHGEWLAEHTGGKAELRADAGHLSLAISSYGQILDGLLGLASVPT
jgi:pimeloyl-ACP methyl ester carboxylesterase